MPGQHARKQALLELLRQRRIDNYSDWYRAAPSPLRTLHSMLWDPDHLTCWRAIEAFGVLTPLMRESNHESLVTLIRKLFWSMNDESGMLCRRAPETIAEILLHAPSMRHDFLPNLTHYVLEEPFEAGICRALAPLTESTALAESDREAITRAFPDLTRLIDVDSPEIRGWAAVALTRLGQAVAIDRIAGITLVSYSFDAGELTEVAVEELIG